MSKMDNLRAMREAKYDANAKRTSGKATAPTKPTPVAPAAPRSKAASAASPTAPAADGTAPATEALCGHRNMSGRTCTREAGHAAKSHRYS
jgi:hypothetical protein